MYKHFHRHFQEEVTILHPGEFFATSEDILLSTVLGSCIAVALHDTKRKVGGLNHFMLPQVLNETSTYYETTTGKFGMFAMELLINDMIKLGARKEDIIAKVFGGASVLVSSGNYQNKIPSTNIEFAFKYLQAEGIPVVAHNVGGTEARKIYYYPKTAKVFLKRIEGRLLSDIKKEEAEYLEQIRERTQKGGEVTLF